MNKVILIGRLARDPELRYTAGNNTAVCQTSIAVDRRFKSENQPTADFIPIVAWRQQAEFISKYFTKGRMAVVEGRLQIRDYKDRDGSKRRTAEVIADNVYFGDSKQAAPGPQSAPAPSYAVPSSYRPDVNAGFAEIGNADEDGDLPF